MFKLFKTQAENVVHEFNQSLRDVSELPTREATRTLIAAILGASELEDITVSLAAGVAYGSRVPLFWKHYKESYKKVCGKPELPEDESPPYHMELAEDSNECNAILFIFQVQCCQKLMLKITLKVGVNVLSATQVSLDCQNLRKILSDKGMMQPSDGTIVDRGTKGKYRVFIYKFYESTRCSDATEENFKFSMSDCDELTLPQIKIDRNVAWAFYCLNGDKNQDYFVKQENSITLLPADFVFPQPISENERMDCLETTIKDHYKLGNKTVPAKIRRIMNPGIGDAYCQFRGGGDIYIFAKLPGEPLIIISEEEARDLQLSPPGGATSSYIIEGKKGECDTNKLKYQLFANTVLTTVDNFVSQMDAYDEAYIQGVEKVSGYGVALTGMGFVGFYKVLMKFGEPMKFITKVRLNQRPQLSAACLVDFSLDYFFGKLKQK